MKSPWSCCCSLVCWRRPASRRRRLRCGRPSRRARSHGRAGGGRAAQWIERSSPRSSRPSPLPASVASRSRPSTARAVARRATSISCRRAGWRCSSTRRARPRAWGLGVDMATGTGWPFGGPRSCARRWFEQPRAARWKARRQAHRHEGETPRARRRRAGARSILDRRARALSATVLQGIRGVSARRPLVEAGFAASSMIPSSTTTRAGRRGCRQFS